MVNQCVFTGDVQNEGLLYMLLGHVSPPVFLNAESAQTYFQQTGYQTAVQPRGSYVMSAKTAEELWRALGTHLGKPGVEGT